MYRAWIGLAALLMAGLTAWGQAAAPASAASSPSAPALPGLPKPDRKAAAGDAQPGTFSSKYRKFQPPAGEARPEKSAPGKGVGRPAGVAPPAAPVTPPKPRNVAPKPYVPKAATPSTTKPAPAEPNASSPAAPGEMSVEDTPEADAKKDTPSEAKDDAAEPNAPKSAVVAGAPKPTGKAAEFHAQYKEFFADNVFDDELLTYWQGAFEEEPERRAELVQESAACAAEAVAAGLAASPMAVGSVWNGLAWLDQLYAVVDEAGWRDAGLAIGAAFSEAPAALAVPLESPANAEESRIAMQTCLSLALYGDLPALKRWLALPQRTAVFLEGAQAFLFGGAALTEEQFNALGSLFQAVPREVHQVLAVVVPEGAGMDTQSAGLRALGSVIDVYAGVSGYTSAEEFFGELGAQPVAPAFTIEAALQLVRAAQWAQFGLRPELRDRRDLILRNAGAEPTRYLRRGPSPGAYQGEPDELLPQTAYLWFIDSAAAFQQAGGLLRFKEGEAMDAVLLLADLLSGGEETAPVFRTGLDGIVSRSGAALQRSEIAPGLVIAHGISMGGEYWSFGIDADGGVTPAPAPVAIDDDATAIAGP